MKVAVRSRGTRRAEVQGEQVRPRHPLRMGWTRPPKTTRHERVRGIGSIMAVGWAVRLLLAPFTSEQDDTVYYRASVAAAHHLGLYARPGFSYPPVWGHILQFLGLLLPRLGLPASSFATMHVQGYLLLSNDMSAYITSPLYNLSFKLVLFLFDMATALAVRALVLRMTGDARRARLGFVLFFLNPLVIFASAVMGSPNIIVCFSLVLGVYGVLTRRYFLAGAVLALGCLTKVVPLFAVPVLVAAIIVRNRQDRDRKGGQRLPSIGPFVCGGLAITVAILLPELLTGSFAAMVRSTLQRGAGLGPVGGASVYRLGTFVTLGKLLSWAQTHDSAVQLVSDGAEALSVAWAVVNVARKKGDVLVLVSGVTLVMAATVLTSPFSQPLYVLWLVPTAVVLRTVCGRYRFDLWALTIGPIVLIVFGLGPLALVSPLAASTSALTIGQVWTSVIDWRVPITPGLWASSRQADINSLAVLAIVAGEVAMIVRSLWSSRPVLPVRTVPVGGAPDVVAPGGPNGHAGRVAQLARGSARRRDRRASALAFALVAGSLVCSLSVAIFVGDGRPEGRVRLLSGLVQGRVLSVKMSASLGPADTALRIVAFPIAPVPRVQSVYVFYDTAYPLAGGTAQVASTLSNHLRAEFGLRDWRAKVSLVDAAQLRRLFLDTKGAPGSVIIDVTGVLPSSSFAPAGTAGQGGTNLVKPWLVAGGTLVWGGEQLGFYSAGPGESASFESKRYLDFRRRGPPQIVGRHRCKPLYCIRVRHKAVALAPPGSRYRMAPNPTSLGSALGISYRAIQEPVDGLAALRAGGRLLGWRGDGASSVTTLPIGAGHLVVFAGLMDEVNETDEDIALILLSHAYSADGPPLLTTLAAPTIARAGGLVTWSARLPGRRLKRGTELELLAMDPNRLGTLASSWILTAGTAANQSAAAFGSGS